MVDSPSIPGRTETTLWQLRAALETDVSALVELERACFDSDRLNRRQFKWMINKANSVLTVAVIDDTICAYVLLLFRRATSLARLYSIAIHDSQRGKGLADALMVEAERLALERECIYLRLEVKSDNSTAMKLYERHGYRSFGRLLDYYEDHSSAERFEKRIYQLPEDTPREVPFYEQSMDFTCGPACLIMAMQAQAAELVADRHLEIQLWREATTVFMTSGHGGCSPQGLALAAWRRGFKVELFLSQTQPLFLEGVRILEKKAVIRLVHEDFVAQIAASDVVVHQHGLSVNDLMGHREAGGIPMVLISSYRLTHSKAPHWVVVAACDSRFIYLHDPDVETDEHCSAADNMYLPVKHTEFERMIRFGQSRSQAAVIVYPGSVKDREKR